MVLLFELKLILSTESEISTFVKAGDDPSTSFHCKCKNKTINIINETYLTILYLIKSTKLIMGFSIKDGSFP